MELAKPCIDIGIQTNQRDEMLDFWQQTIGLPYEEMLKLGGGSQQHRHTLNGSVFKLNHNRNPLPDNPPTGIRRLRIAREGQDAPVEHTDPDGNAVLLVPMGHEGVTHIGVDLTVRSLADHQAFFDDMLQVERLAADRFRWATTVFFLHEDKAAQPVGDMAGRGYRYLTVQVFDVDGEHAAFLARGGTEGRPPVTLGTTARISFIRDPDGNWIEVSQRASLTGPLPTDR